MIIYDNKGIVILDIEVNDTSVRYKAIKGENTLTLKYSLDKYVEVPIGSYAIFKNEKYILMSPQDLILKHRRNIEYSLVMHSEDARSKRYKFVNSIDKRLKFSLTAKPKEHLQMFVDNMNMRDGKDYWTVGRCPDHVEIVLSYNHTYCHDALVQLADKLKLDYWYEGHTINLGKLEINKNNPLPLSYGGDGQGLKPDIKRNNFNAALPIEVLYVQGSETNINSSKYGAPELHLPTSQTIGYDGEFFEDEEGFDTSKARYYRTDENGFYIVRADKEIKNNSEDSLDCSEIYPTKEETVESVIEVNKEKHFYDLLFKSTVDYSKYVIDGETATIIFQSGMLAGKEFDLATDTDGNLICKPDGEYMRVEIVPQTIDGITMPDPDSGYMPNAGEDKDTFKVFNIQLPQEYIRRDATKSGAEWDAFRYAVKHMYANEDPQYTITGTLDELYAKRNWENIEGRLYLGNYISFSDKSFQEEPILIRIIGIKEFVNKPHSPTIEFSNQNIGGTLVGELNRVENEEAHTEEIIRQSRNFTKRRFSSAQETLEMLQAAFKNFSEGISPVTVRTMAMLVGDESLQFKFTASRSSLTDIPCPISYNKEKKQMQSVAASLVHMTLGVEAITAPESMAASDYRGWDIPASDGAILEDEAKSYYVYVKANANKITAEFILSDTSIEIGPHAEEVEGSIQEYYYFLVGILNSEYDGSRDFITLYGFTEVLPGQITTDVIRSADGKTYFDLSKGEIGGHITFTNNSGENKSVADFVEQQENTNQAVQDQIDGVVENWSGAGKPTTANYPASNWSTDADKIAHINDTYVNVETYVDDDTTPDAGKAWRWCDCSALFDVINVAPMIYATWTVIGTIDVSKGYTKVGIARNGVNFVTYTFSFDTQITIWTGPPVYIKVDGQTGEVSLLDASGYSSGGFDSIRFYYFSEDYVEVTDKDGNTYNLHWHPIADSDAVRALIIAGEAGEVAKKANDRMVEWTSDNKVSPTEITAIRQELNFISKDSSDIIENATRYGVSSFAFNLAATNYTNILQNIIADYEALEDKSEAISVQTTRLNNMLINYYNQRTALLSKIEDAIKALIDEKAKVTDIEYLTNAFKDGSTDISGGLVMSEMVAVKDENENVVAFLNGSEVVADDEHGKVILAGGIPSGDGTIEERVKDAMTKIFEDGRVETTSLFASFGKISAFDFNEDGLSYIKDNSGIIVNKDKFWIVGTRYVGRLISYNAFGIDFSVGNGQMFMSGERNLDSVEEHPDKPALLLVHPGNTYEAEKAYAVAYTTGMMAGVRTSSKVITSTGPHTLTRYDYNILVNLTTGTCYVQLPSSPLDGQEYVIETKGANVVISSSSNNLYSHKTNNSSLVNSFEVNLRGVFRMKYYAAASQWTFCWIDSY